MARSGAGMLTKTSADRVEMYGTIFQAVIVLVKNRAEKGGGMAL